MSSLPLLNFVEICSHELTRQGPREIEESIDSTSLGEAPLVLIWLCLLFQQTEC